MGLKKVALQRTNHLLDRLGFRLVRSWQNRDPEEYIPFHETIAAANQAGLPLGDWIDQQFCVPGATQNTIDEIAQLGVFSQPIERVCEIGPGTGRYLEKTQKACRPAYYEIYETAEQWQTWCVDQYGVVAQPANKWKLTHTADASIDLVQAHKVFSWTTFLVCISNFSEMTRVVRKNGHVIFDAVTEVCMDEESVAGWKASGTDWPGCLMPRQYLLDFFTRRGLSLVGTFFIPLLPGKTEYFVFKKDG